MASPPSTPKAGWEVKPLGETATVGAGNSAPQKKELFENGTYPFIRTSDIGKIRIGSISSSSDLLNSKGIVKLKEHRKGTILFPKSGASTFLNHRVIMDVDGYVSSHLATIKGNPTMALDRFLLFFLITIKAQDLIQDHKYPSLKLSDIKQIPIPVPPLPEQERIVGILDEAFEGIAAATDQAEKNLHNARELFQSVLQSTFSQKGDDWEEVEVQEVTKLSRGHNPPKSTFVYTPQPGYVRFYQIRDGSSEAHKVYVPETPQLHRVVETDILMVAYRHVGRAFRGANGAFNVALCKITNAKPDRLDDDFLFYLVPSDLIRGELLKLSERSLIPSMSVKELARLKIPLPPLPTQQAIVEKLDALSEETKALEAIYERKQSDLAELKQSLLQKAFAGEL